MSIYMCVGVNRVGHIHIVVNRQVNRARHV